MVDFKLNEKQTLILNAVKDFREKFIEKIDLRDEYRVADPRKRFPWNIVREGSRLGLRTMSISEEYGGIGADVVSLCLAEEELAYGELGIGVIFAQVWKMASLLERVCNKEQRERYLSAFVKDPEMLIAFGGTESSGGSDIWLPYNAPDAGIKTTAIQEKDEWIIKGRKIFISLAPEAKLFMIAARTDTKKPPFEGTSVFIVEGNTPGLRIGEVYDKMGERFVNNAEVILDDVRVPKENLLGELNGAYGKVLTVINESNPLAGATALGNARRAYETALQWANERVQGGKHLIEHQAIGVEFADMRIKLRAARDLVLEAAWGCREGLDPSIGWMSKCYASEVGFEVCRKAFELQGGYSAMSRSSRLEKCLRDAAMFLHSDLANTTIRIKIWNWMRGLKFTPTEFPQAQS